jgi:hypothetical protein
MNVSLALTMLSAHKGQPEYSNTIFTALRDIALDGPDTFALTDDLSLVRPDQTFLAHRWDDVMTQAEIKDEATTTRASQGGRGRVRARLWSLTGGVQPRTTHKRNPPLTAKSFLDDFWWSNAVRAA